MRCMAALPVFGGFAGAFRGNGQVEFRNLFHVVDEALDHGCGRCTLYGNGTAGPQDGPQGPEEEFFFNHDVGYLPILGIKEVAYQEVPHGGVGDAQDNGLGLFHGTAYAFPAHFSEEPAAELGPAGAHFRFNFCHRFRCLRLPVLSRCGGCPSQSAGAHRC